MATAPEPQPLDGEALFSATERGDRTAMPRQKQPQIKVVPDVVALREQIRRACEQVAAGLDKSLPLDRRQMEALGRGILGRLGQADQYLGWTMVMLASAFWRDQVAAVPTTRRLFLLPHCLRQAETCPGVYDETGLDCGDCTACTIADYRRAAEERGYRVLVAEGSPAVMRLIVSGEADAIVGVACLNVLEKAFDKILLAGIPCMAVPLLSSNCRNTAVDTDWIDEMLTVARPEPVAATRTYVHLMRAACRMFGLDQLQQIAWPLREGGALAVISADARHVADPIAGTQAIAYDFLLKGGKYSRPFITLAVYDALTGARGTGPDGERHIERFPAAVRRIGLCIESFHKASLVHDDIEDNDAYRYGSETLHRRYGTATAINVGDYLVGLGYRLVARQTEDLGPPVTADLLRCLADAHTRLCEGQGAELLWRDASDKRLTPLDALKIYALKTAPAFEAALYCGARLVGPAERYAETFRKFARHLGVAFQVLNDLKDWQGDCVNNRCSGGDVLSGRPTVLWALALETLSEAEQAALIALADSGDPEDETRLDRARSLYRAAGVVDKAHQLVERHQQRARGVADGVEPDDLRRLLYYLIDCVLERPSDDPAAAVVSEIATAWLRPYPAEDAEARRGCNMLGTTNAKPT